MIIRLIIALVGVIMDIAIVAFAILAFVDWYNRHKKEGGAK